ncbi:acyl carrier protein [Streptomyces boncukensis]|uniref:Acyl carrier protein n=1 Tax=Streptomyces boncukensis TaxID=2711219 RepID=A0A6G4WPT9_9ACTN|nr:acyl carrier protein [Streptomyces boncukensis]NGO66842.1 acyl carrier protein [Streptomyces boncukensis]
MIHRTPTASEICRLPASERRDALEELLAREFKASLLMDEEEEFPLDGNFFDLGLTSLRVAELKQRLERLLGCEISTNVLFNSPNLARLLDHMVTEVLPGLSGGPLHGGKEQP